MKEHRAIVIGAGIGGLTSAALLARHGFAVTVVEQHAAPGGKMRQIEIDGAVIDGGPTVFTMRWVFDELFDQLGTSFEASVPLETVTTLARHAWDADGHLDLFSDLDQSVDAISAFAGAAEGARYRAFAADAEKVYLSMRDSFIKAPRPSVTGMVASAGFAGLPGLIAARPYSSLWDVLGKRFMDKRLRQLFARYSTYCGSSPFEAPGSLVLIAHVEREGVYLVNGGMHKIARALEAAGARHGADYRYNEVVREIETERGRASAIVLGSGERIEADCIVCNGDLGALTSGAFGPDVRDAEDATTRDQRSLSAMTWAMHVKTDGFPLIRHNVFFSDAYRREFDSIFGAGEMPETPTVYVCAQDRGDAGDPAPTDEDGNPLPERLLCLINAPANGDIHEFSEAEIEQCANRTFQQMALCGLTVERTPSKTVVTTPSGFNRLFPATGGALYGRATHGPMASFQRPGAASRIPGLYLAGGSVHPGAGVPMAALSGRQAAVKVLADLGSTRSSYRVATRGGMSMR